MSASSGPSGFDPSPWLKVGQDMMQGVLDFLAQQKSQLEKAGISFPPLGAASNETEALQVLQRDFAQRHLSLWAEMLKPTGAGTDTVSDRRFVSSAWSESPVFDYIRRAYLLNAEYLTRTADAVPVTDRNARNRQQFLVRQYIDLMSPANFAATNPDFVKQAIETQGESITQGIRNLIGDLEKGRISMTDETAFEVGRNLAITPGAVIFENEIFQLIQYRPATTKVRERPLLIVPPCINKFYILDLQPENSFVRFAVEQGVTVFLVSWRNPGLAQGRLTWDDYIEEGVLRAIAVVREVSGAERPNTLGFCVGGTLLASALAIAAARGARLAESCTFLTTLLDFEEPGDLGCFVDQASVAAKESTIGKGGLLSGREFSSVFSALRPNDLIWNYVVDNYLKGKAPTAFDLLFWNADSTNVPGPFAAWYLRNTYLENNLRVPGKLIVAGAPLDLGRIDCPSYFLATREDHIVPWRSSYLGRRLVGGETTFVLGASGHIAGVVNPASKNRRSYWTGGGEIASADQWLAQATEAGGSWWSHWIRWLHQYSGKEVAPPKQVGNRRYKKIEPAPGRFVKEPA